MLKENLSPSSVLKLGNILMEHESSERIAVIGAGCLGSTEQGAIDHGVKFHCARAPLGLGHVRPRRG